MEFRHKFVDFIPSEIEDRILYISMEYCTASHKCPCGCGTRVVTPLTPINWQLIFDGDTISLEPSIGNWSDPCQSHYWITKNEIVWAEKWSQKKIEKSREKKAVFERSFFKQKK